MAGFQMLNEKQKYALKAAQEGHNLLITGQCGTGKTHLLRLIIMKLRLVKEVAVTASTGMAGTQIGLDATTLHYWSGLGDARFSNEELQALFLTDVKFSEARERIRKTDVLAIDEIGMVSATVFEKLEVACRLAKNNNQLFGGLQVIACGDFKQLPPVPNYRYDDPGYYCFRGDNFKEVFPHHFDLTEVVRQSEKDLVRAINQLCNGCPDEETELLLKSLNRELSDETGVCRLVGTNFDAAYINHMYMELHDGELHAFKSTDEGKTNLLQRSGAEKILSLKIGAPVILTRNLPGHLHNGMQGTVHEINENGPIVNFNGRLVALEKIKFEVYDPKLQKNLATRLQFPLKLAYALTVHRAQGQTLHRVEIDCFSFFAPGQMGVAVGRAECKERLRILNYNAIAAHLKHPKEVYDFYMSESRPPVANLECCRQDFPADIEEAHKDTPEKQQKKSTPNTTDPIASTSAEPETVICPWPLDLFIASETGKSFMPINISDNFRISLYKHAGSLYGVIDRLLRKKPKTNDDFSKLYKEVNKYLTSDEHVHSCTSVEAPKPQKLSSKLFFWLLDREIDKLSTAVVKPQEEKFKNPTGDLDEASDAAKSKIRYVAGACLCKIISRLRTNVLNKIGKPGKVTRTERDWDYRRQKLLKSLRISEEEAMKLTTEPESMREIESRQGPSRGLLHVSDNVFHFFMDVNHFLQRFLSPQGFHLYGDKIYTIARSKLFANEQLLDKWIALFSVPDSASMEEDEVFVIMLEELYELVGEHFLRISLVDGLHHFKTEIPKKKKQAIRSKITALSEREILPKKKAKKQCDEVQEGESKEETYACPKCKEVLIENPLSYEDQSVACDYCNLWYHFKCEGLSGKETVFQRSNSKWKCSSCAGKGKGKGRGKTSKR